MAIGCYELKTDEVKFITIRNVKPHSERAGLINVPAKYVGCRALVTILDDNNHQGGEKQ